MAALVDECREITARNTLAPMQRAAANGGKGIKRDASTAVAGVAEVAD